MSKLLSSQNRPRVVVILVAVVARVLLGGIPVIGGLISLGLMVVILFQIYKVASSMIRTSPSTQSV